MESASLGHATHRELRYDLSDLDRRECQSGATSCGVGRVRRRARQGIGKDGPAHGIRVWG